MDIPITSRVKNARCNIKFPKGMEISISADGTGPVVPERNPSPAKKGGCNIKK